MNYKLIFIGYGEAAYYLSKGLASEGFHDFAAYDIAWQDKEAGKLIQSRAGEAGVPLLSSTKEACESGAYIIALTSPAEAVDTAKGCFPWLKEGQIYIDGNSAGPAAMKEIAALPRAKGVLFCDAAALLPFPKKLHKNPLYLAGEGAEQFCDDFREFHMDMKILTGTEPGGASAIKILKSIVMKGLPQLLLESFEAAEAYGVLETFTEALRGSLDHKTVDQLGEAYLARTLVHSRRRIVEMKYAVNTLEEMGIDASMSRATMHKLELLTEENWPAVLSQEQAGSIPYKDAIVMINEHHKKSRGENVMRYSFAELLPDEIIDRAKRLSVAQICDGAKAAKLPIINDGCMDCEMMPVASGMKMVGTAMTVETSDGDNFPIHLVCYKTPQPGYVMVVDGKGYKGRAYAGSLMMGACQAVGYAGAVVDGCTRDKEELSKMGFPVFSRGHMPRGPYKKNEGTVNTPIICGGVKVKPGDLVAGDDDGVVVIPREYVEAVLEQAEMKRDYEEKRVEKITEYKRAVLEGKEPPELAPQWVLDMMAAE